MQLRNSITKSTFEIANMQMKRNEARVSRISAGCYELAARKTWRRKWHCHVHRQQIALPNTSI